MTDSEREELIVEDVIRRMEQFGEDGLIRLTVEDRRLAREYEELAGLIPYAIEPVAPRPEVKAALFARLGLEVPTPIQGTVAPRPIRFPDVATGRRPERPVLLLAAALAVLALGLAGFSAVLYQGQQEQARAIADLRLEVEESRARAESLLAERSSATQLATLVNAPSPPRVCHLAPPAGARGQAVARGMVYFDPERQQYFLVARDLAPCSEGQAYKLWFLVDDRPVLGKSFHVKAGTPVALGSDDLPAGATAMWITLQGIDDTLPDGDPILWGDQSEEML